MENADREKSADITISHEFLSQTCPEMPESAGHPREEKLAVRLAESILKIGHEVSQFLPSTVCFGTIS